MGLLDAIFGTTKSSTSTQSGTSSTQNQAFNDPRFQDFWNQFSNVFKGASSANTPINQYQTGAANQLAGAGNFVFPAYNNVNDVATNGIAVDDINRYMSPYTQNVVDATQNQFNQMNARTLAGQQASRAKAGALTGTQGGVGRAFGEMQLATAQNPVIAGLYQQGYNSAVDTAGKNAAVRTQAAGTQGNLVNAYTNAGQAAYGSGQNIWDSTFKNTMTPFQLMSQGASSWNPFLQGAGTTTTSSGTSSGTQTSTNSPWNIGTGLLGTAMQLFPGFADGGSVGAKKPKEFHEKVTDAFKAITEMKRSMGGGVLPRYDDGGFVDPLSKDPGVNYDKGWTPVVEKEPQTSPWKDWANANAGNMRAPYEGGNDDMLSRQQASLSQFLSGLGRADGGYVRRGHADPGPVFAGEGDVAPSEAPNYPGFSYREPDTGGWGDYKSGFISREPLPPASTSSMPVATTSTGSTPPTPSAPPARYAAPQVRPEMMYAPGNNDMPKEGFWGNVFGNTARNGVLDGRPMSKWDRVSYMVANAGIPSEGKPFIGDAMMKLSEDRRQELEARNKASELLMKQHSHPYDIAHKVASTNLLNTQADKEFALELEKRKAEYAKQLAIAQKEAEMDLLLKNAKRFGIDLADGQPAAPAGANTRLRFVPNPQNAPTGSPSGYSEPKAPEPTVPSPAPAAAPPPKKRNNEPILGNSVETAHPSRAHAYVGQYYKKPDGTVYKKSLLGESADIKQ